ncbi:MAG: carbon storage regulator [Thermotogota bacterium]|nr:carbon storage regulator [Thermotogota bacterium]
MLVLSRKKDEEIYNETTIGNIILKIVDIDEKNVKVGITAPKNMPIYRQEVYEKVYAVNKESVIHDDPKKLTGVLEALKHEDR